MKAVILAGGKGTRMGKISEEIPKPLLNIGDKPVLEHIIILLRQYQITNIILLVNHLKQKIVDYFGNGENFGVNITYFVEENPLGTTGGIKEIEHLLTEDFLFVYGDVMINMDLQQLLNFHNNHKSDGTLVLHPNDHPHDSDLVETDENDKIIAFHAKPHNENEYYANLVNAGLYVLSPKILNYITKGVKADFGKDIFPVIANKLELYGYNTPEYLKDIGTPQRIEQVTNDYLSGKIERFHKSYKRKAIFLDRDGVINEFNGLIYKPEQLTLYNNSAPAIKKINKSEFLTIVITNQPVIARNCCTIKELEYIFKKMETQLGAEGAKIDKIYYCPHHPDKGYPEENVLYKADCNCRKPKPGMLLQAAADFNIDLKNSFFIGDTDTDIIAGKSAGTTTIGVMTGIGCKKITSKPDYFFADIAEAVDFIINEPFKKQADEILEKIKKSSRNPHIITVAGNAQSGKTTFSNYLQKRIEEENISTFKIELDNWILPENKRENCKNVFDRFQIKKIDADIKEILNSKEIILETYNKHEQNIASETIYKYNNEQVVIIEGVPAMSSEYLLELTDCAVFMKIDKEIHKKRIFNLYKWKGYENEAIETLYIKRELDEYDLIEKEIKFADIIVSI